MAKTAVGGELSKIRTLALHSCVATSGSIASGEMEGNMPNLLGPEKMGASAPF